MLQTGEPIISTDPERALLLYMIGVILLVTALIIAFFVVFQKRKNKILMDKMQEKQRFEKELANSRVEIQEQTLKNVGQELHDNIGQLLSYTNMQLNLVNSIAEDDLRPKLEETKRVLGEAIEEVRSLSKSLNRDVISNFGLVSSIENEVNRLNKLKSLKATFSLMHDSPQFKDSGDELILFRIIQEFFSNTLKYAEAKHLDIRMEPYNRYILITVEDDGKGFDNDNYEAGSGLINMKSRAKLINTDLEFTTKPGQGVRMRLFYPIADS